jgi:hypothetical protein
MNKPHKTNHTLHPQGRKHASTHSNLTGADALIDPDSMTLLGKFTVHPDYFEIIESRVNDILPHLLEGAQYTPIELIGEELWSDTTTLGRRQAILCLKHMTTMSGSRLRQVEFTGSELSTFEITADGGVARVPVAKN